MGLSRSTAMLVAAGAIGLGSHAAAQTIQGGWEIHVSNVVSPSQPTATVEVWAWFDNVPAVSELFASGNFDLAASEGVWSNVAYPLAVPDPPGHLIVGSRINNVITAQLHLPPILFGNPSNPVLAFTADWTTNNFSIRDVLVETENTSSFNVYNQQGALTPLWPNGFSPGSGSIRVVPAPSLLLLPAVAFAAAQRRHRSTVTGITRTSSQRALTAIKQRVTMYGNRSH